MATHYFHESVGTPGQMGAKATVVCDAYVSSVRIEVDIQKKIDGSWATIATDPRPNFASPVPAKKKKTGQNFMPCASGTYRGKGNFRIVTTTGNVINYSTEGMSATDPCD